ncbi:hypothetical protein ACEQ8H_002234 [Pleosporales sp. CAS-2024a]
MAHAGTLHKYNKKLVAFEHGPSDAASNVLLWIGGLGDGLLTVEYAATIASSLPRTWTLAEVLLRSSYNGWTTGRLSRDAREMGECVRYFQGVRGGGGAKVVLMGHSTGCQDIMEYLVGADAQTQPRIDGAILQGGVSDREAWADLCKTDEEKAQLGELVEAARTMIAEGNERAVMPAQGNMLAQAMGAPATAYRTYSLLAKGADDDYFSSDLGDDVLRNTFGRLPKETPVCFLLGSEDPYVPTRVDKKALLERWASIIREGGGVVDDKNGGVVEGAHHNLNGDPEHVVQDLVKRVCGFIEGLDKTRESDTSGARL